MRTRDTQKDAEVRTRIERVLASPGRTAIDPEVLRHLRAVEVLERIGTPKARACLERLATGAATSRITEEAVSALGRRR